MHTERRRLARATAIALASCALLAIDASGQPQIERADARRASAVRAALRVVAPETLTAETIASVSVFVRLPEGREQPLLLTPSTVGDAVRVARGRMLRADARQTAEGELHFQVPIEARSAGSAVLRVALLTYHCTTRCKAVRASESVTLQVRAR